MDLAKRDNEIQHLYKLIKDNQKFLNDKHKHLNNSQNDNPLLKDIVEDYSTYFSHISDEKTQQHKALQKLAKYITEVSLHPDVTEEILRECKYDNTMIANEMKRLV